MKKEILMVIGCVVGLRGWAQSGETVTEEGSSSWVKVAAATITAAPAPRKRATTTATATTRKSPAPVKKAETKPKPGSTNTFNKANSQVKRFKKKSG